MFFVLQAASDIGKKAEDTEADNQNQRLQNFPSYLSWEAGFKIWGFPKIVGFPPKSSILIGVFHYFHHPFWGKHPYFWKHPSVFFFFSDPPPKKSHPVGEDNWQSISESLRTWGETVTKAVSDPTNYTIHHSSNL